MPRKTGGGETLNRSCIPAVICACWWLMLGAPTDLVIFGCGYVGSAVARQAQQRGLRVTALTRNPVTAADLRARGVEVIVADLAETNWHARIPAGAEWVLNAVSSGGGGIDAYRRSYVEGMRSIFGWATAHGPVGTLVYTGSTSVYPQSDGLLVTEEMPAEPETDRGQLLREAERVALAGAAAGAFRRAIVLRLAGLYGPGREHLVGQVRSGVIGGIGPHRLNLAHRDDVCRAIWAALAAPASVESGLFNVADDAPAPKAEVAHWLAQRLGFADPVFSGAPTGSRERLTPDRVICNRKLRQVLGWTPGFPTYREGYENILSRAAD